MVVRQKQKKLHFGRAETWRREKERKKGGRKKERKEEERKKEGIWRGCETNREAETISSLVARRMLQEKEVTKSSKEIQLKERRKTFSEL